MHPDEITLQRLTGWRVKLAQENATPLALVGISQGANSGALVVCVPENGPPDRQIATILRAVADRLDRR